MASQYLGDLKKQLQCFLCKGTMTDPKLVDCFHVFCKECVKKDVEVDQQNDQDYIFKCPQCDSKTLVPNAEDLQTSPVHVRIVKVLELVENQRICSVSSSHPEAFIRHDCTKSLCEECLCFHPKNHQVVSLSELKREDIDSLLQREQFCKIHDNQNVEFNCEDCGMLICQLCVKEQHNKHKTRALQDIIASERNSLCTYLEQLDKMTSDEKEKKQHQEIALMIKRDGEKAKQQVQEHTEKLIKVLRKNEEQLLNEIQESLTKADRTLRIGKHVTQAKEYIRFIVENGAASDMIDIRQYKSAQSIICDPLDETICGIEFKPCVKLCKAMKDGIGEVELSKRADSLAHVLFSTNLDIMKKAKLVKEKKTSESDVPEERLKNTATHSTTTDAVNSENIAMRNDSEAVDSTPRVSGQLSADPNIPNGNPVCNNPSAAMPEKPLQCRETHKHSKLKNALNTGFKSFTGIAVNQTCTRIAVAGNLEHVGIRIRVFSIEGDLLLTYGSKGSGNGQLKCPEGLAFLNETDLVIADSKNHRICIADTNTGHMIRAFGRRGRANGMFVNPTGVHVDDDENIIVCDRDNFRVQVFTKNGSFRRKFSVPGFPQSVVKHNGLFYVCSKSQVHVIEMKNNQSPSTIATFGERDLYGQPLNPKSLAIANDNNLLVSYISSSHRGDCSIHKFTMNGTYLYLGQSSQLSNLPCYIGYMVVLNDGHVICTTHTWRSTGGKVVFFDGF